uniref:NADH-ubiquinone oxidoreductase chain 1 n=1 Tax=Lepidurus apus lubbocki TaxID=217954 RepID=A0A5B7XWR4_9CRUS|nr:NADH dehydrogenase subunit 1 [Lepidurus apus lubbocki]QCZ36061.1 NADH dehydrogenase subunit 1 [Lepidurus apus lubbocki]
MFFLLSYLMSGIGVLVGVAFLTLFERKLLGYIQLRKGPNSVGLTGILQPFADAIKLFIKEQTFPFMSNYLPYYIAPVISLSISLLIWISIPWGNVMINSDLMILFLLCCISISVYSLLAAGWSSNSKYSLLGALRAVAQTISYEVSLALILLSFVMLISNYKVFQFVLNQNFVWFLFISPLLALLWFVSCLAETNRTPFDFAEGESELVSGFNTEYSSGGFALIMLSEYTSILFMSTLFVMIFLGGWTNLFVLKFLFIVFMFVWVRGTLPRFRYDKLMFLAWKSFLPISLNYLMFFSGYLMLF